ncbi:MAG: hypothetical protein LBB66_07345 [Desulfovibrio sp.]|jgi:hypothetical protein|nr:hypothetical protein [Desulfovibrio sp.]
MTRLRRLFAVPVPALLFCCLNLCLTPCQGRAAQAGPPQKAHQQTGARPLHAPSWVFSSPASRETRQWQHGVGAGELKKKAVPASQAERSVNTASAIDEALKRAERISEKQGGLNLSIRNESSSFKEAQPQDGASPHPGENPVRAGRHIVGAFADVQSGEDLRILVGPELSIKDELSMEKSAGSQPDSSLGMGMRFKLDF